MNISGKCDYACRAMVELAARYDRSIPVSAQLIAEQRAIPEKYLTHILLQLKRSELVRSMRGAQGGYVLAKHPSAITLLHIIEAIDGPVLAPPNSEQHEMHAFWQEITDEVGGVLSMYTLEKILEMTSKSTMFHI